MCKVLAVHQEESIVWFERGKKRWETQTGELVAVLFSLPEPAPMCCTRMSRLALLPDRVSQSKRGIEPLGYLQPIKLRGIFLAFLTPRVKAELKYQTVNKVLSLEIYRTELNTTSCTLRNKPFNAPPSLTVSKETTRKYCADTQPISGYVSCCLFASANGVDVTREVRYFTNC